MKVLIVGSGGREHAIATAVAKSPKVDKIYCAPGNAGIGQVAECVNIGAMEFDKLVDFAKEKEIDLTVIGMDDPLVGGIVDKFEEAGLRVFGPRKNAAILEGSKAFSKDLMKKYNIPTAGYENFDSPEEAMKYLETSKYPIVLKADGLALGKGVLICNTKEEAIEFIIKNTINDNNLIKYMIESDEFSNYELENKIAILASNSSNQNTKVIIGILTKPILWNKKKVQLIIMPLIGNEKNYNIFDLFKELSYLAQNSVYIKRIIKKQSEEEIIKIFNEIEEILN